MLYPEPIAPPVVANSEPANAAALAPAQAAVTRGPLKVGLVGAGYWGPKLLRNFHTAANSRVRMVADLNPKLLADLTRQYRDIETTTDFKQMLDSDVEAVVIATPVSTHYRLASEALLAGKHVMVEKPITRTSQEAQKLIDLAESRGLTLMVGHTFEYNPAVEMLRHLVVSGEIGKVMYVSATRTNLGLFQKDINVLWDLAPHDLSIILFVLGVDPVAVSASGAAYVQPGIHDVARMTVDLDGGVQAHIHVSWLDPCKVRKVTVVGSKKMVVFDDIEAQEKIKVYDKGVDVPERTADYGEFQLSYRYGGITIPRVPLHEPLSVECAHFVDSVQRRQTPRSSGRVGLKVVKILESADISLHNGSLREPIRW
jgi:predicted dehydrogenase